MKERRKEGSPGIRKVGTGIACEGTNMAQFGGWAVQRR